MWQGKERTGVHGEKSNITKYGKRLYTDGLCPLSDRMYSVVDGLFIGRAVGDEGLAAVNLAWPVPAVTALGIGIGISGKCTLFQTSGEKRGRGSFCRFM